MKRILGMLEAVAIFAMWFFAALFGSIGCHAQVPPGPTTYSCPTATVGGSAYTPLNNTAATYSTGTTYSDTTVSAGGTFCYIEQSTNGTNSSVPSNVIQITVPVGDQVNMSWTDPSVTTGIVGYVTSRATATPNSAPGAPTLAPAVTVADNGKPTDGRQPVIAKDKMPVPIGLKALASK